MSDKDGLFLCSGFCSSLNNADKSVRDTLGAGRRVVGKGKNRAVLCNQKRCLANDAIKTIARGQI